MSERRCQPITIGFDFAYARWAFELGLGPYQRAHYGFLSLQWQDLRTQWRSAP